MDNANYTSLTRQSGLMREMQIVAHNIANISTTGFRKEGIVFSEFVRRLEGDEPSLSMALANGRHISLRQGGLTQTNGTFDFAIEGDGFFLVETPQGERLTRAGHFTPNAEGELVTPDGYRLLDGGGAPIFIPPDAAKVALGTDGTLSADGLAFAQVGVFVPADPLGLQREAGTLFRSPAGTEPLEGARLVQGYLEESNVDPIAEVARMIEVQRAYELGQSFIEREDERIRAVVQALGK
ncbi:flagellar hook-basal body complex protein [Plastorhodobacter daqingensis]|uniref:Flagellar basal-body rod protein FlgF n=1 Tax=Plastorhodobacter daqingensis TaxID=1387281 RepID=A0ABW2UGD8_9RHOB